MRQSGWGQGFMQMGSVNTLNLSSVILHERSHVKVRPGLWKAHRFLALSVKQRGYLLLIKSQSLLPSQTSPTPISFPYLPPLPVCFLPPTSLNMLESFFYHCQTFPPLTQWLPPTTQPYSLSPCQPQFSTPLLSLTISTSSLLSYFLTLSNPVLTLPLHQNYKILRYQWL